MADKMVASQFSFDYISVWMTARVIILVSNYVFGVNEHSDDILKANAKAKYV